MKRILLKRTKKVIRKVLEFKIWELEQAIAHIQKRSLDAPECRQILAHQERIALFRQTIAEVEACP